MYLKRYTVRKSGQTYTYLRLVSGFRDEHGKVQHKIIANLGREDVLKASGQLNQLAAAFTRLDPPMLGIRREVGALLLVRHYLQRLGLVQIIDAHVAQRGRAELTTGEVIAALVANRLCAPAPLYDVAGWAMSAAVHELLDVPGGLLNDDRLGRALDAFAPVAESVRGAVALAAINAFGLDAGRLHLDLTTLRVAGAYADSTLVAKGWSSERTVARQVRVLQAVTGQGVPLYVRPHGGDTAELTCIGAALERLSATLGKGLLVCADSALGHVKNLCEAHRAGLRFIVPLRLSTGYLDRFRRQVGTKARMSPLRYVSDRERGLPSRRRTKYRGALRSFEVVDEQTGQPHGFRIVYVWSSEEARSTSEARQRALAKAEQSLERIRRGLGGRYYRTKKAVDAKVATILIPQIQPLLRVETATRRGKPTLTWKRDERAIAEAASTDGLYALATNLTGRISPSYVLRTYKQQALVEMRHRDAKSTLRVRPLFLHNDARISALVSVVGLALLVFGLVETDLRRAIGPGEHLDGLLPEHRSARPTARNAFAVFQGLGLTYTPAGLALDRLTATQRRVLALLGISPAVAEAAAA